MEFFQRHGRDHHLAGRGQRRVGWDFDHNRGVEWCERHGHSNRAIARNLATTSRKGGVGPYDMLLGSGACKVHRGRHSQNMQVGSWQKKIRPVKLSHTPRFILTDNLSVGLNWQMLHSVQSQSFSTPTPVLESYRAHFSLILMVAERNSPGKQGEVGSRGRPGTCRLTSCHSQTSFPGPGAIAYSSGVGLAPEWVTTAVE